MSDSKKIVLIGLPSSGKTTFLAALWYLVDGKNNTTLTVDELHGDREYLNNIREKWLTCDPLDRTRLTNEHVVSMKLNNINNNEKIHLNIPDLSGETFLHQWLHRNWTPEFQDTLVGACGALLFVHPNEIKEPQRIDQAAIVQSGIIDDKEQDYSTSYAEFNEWDASLAPTQVQLVELLQFIQIQNVTEHPFNLAVIISAWDLLKNFKGTPNDWLKKTLPLLWQYLSTNTKDFPFNVYGVSAQGGDYQSEEKKLSDYDDPRKRISVIVSKDKKRDITIPLVWLTSENNE